MSAVVGFQSNNTESVKKAFDTLMVNYSGDKSYVLELMKQNPIAVANADVWEGELSQTISYEKSIHTGHLRAGAADS
jgi:hypothetical protein